MEVLGPCRANEIQSSCRVLCRHVDWFIIVSENKRRSSSLMPGNSIRTDRLTRDSRSVKRVFPAAARLVKPTFNTVSFHSLIIFANVRVRARIDYWRKIFKSCLYFCNKGQQWIYSKTNTINNQQHYYFKQSKIINYVSYEWNRRFVRKLSVEPCMSAVRPSQCGLLVCKRCLVAGYCSSERKNNE